MILDGMPLLLVDILSVLDPILLTLDETAEVLLVILYTDGVVVLLEIGVDDNVVDAATVGIHPFSVIVPLQGSLVVSDVGFEDFLKPRPIPRPMIPRTKNATIVTAMIIIINFVVSDLGGSGTRGGSSGVVIDRIVGGLKRMRGRGRGR